MITYSKRIEEFQRALQEEINHLKRGRGSNKILVYEGKFEKVTNEMYVYTFKLESSLIAIDDTPAEIIVHDEKSNCHIVTIEGNKVSIAVERKIGENIKIATILINNWYLLELLKKKYKEEQYNKQKFMFSEIIFRGESKASNLLIDDSNVTTINNNLNTHQLDAIKNACNNTLSIIWGPPGTGKTKTISGLVEAHLKKNNRVLLLSHANTAVDQALKNVAKHLKESKDYNEGNLVRLGVCSSSSKLDTEYPMVILDNIVNYKSKELLEEKDKLEKRKYLLKRDKVKLEEIRDLSKGIEELHKNQMNYNLEFKNYKNKIDELSDDIAKNETKLNNAKYKLEKARNSNKLVKIILSLNEDRIQDKIIKLQKSIRTYKSQSKDLREEANKIEVNIMQIDTDIKKMTKQRKKKLEGLNIDLKNIEIQLKTSISEEEKINEKLSVIKEKIDNISKNILVQAKVMGTTLTKTFCSNKFPENKFDVLIIDEVSMAPLPYIYWALTKVNTFVTLVGDFNQLSPICSSNKEISVKWLKRNIFNLLDIDEVHKVDNNKIVKLLPIQYRMPKVVADIPNELFYEGKLKTADIVKNNFYKDLISGKNSLALIDTCEVDPWCSKLSIRSRFNIYNALIDIVIAERLIKKNKKVEIGITTPYRAQANLITMIAKDKGLIEYLTINTIHSFQGGEKDIMIFDTVEGLGDKNWTMLESEREGSEANLLLNVAITRTKKKIYLVTNTKHMKKLLKANSKLLKIISIFIEKGKRIYSEEIMKIFVAEDLETWITIMENEIKNLKNTHYDRFNDKGFWPAFKHDIIMAKEEIIILSPFITIKRVENLLPIFKELISNGINIKIYTKPLYELFNVFENAKEAIDILTNIGVIMMQRELMHEKIAIIDNNVVWQGSLNIMSHNDTKEYMVRSIGENTVKEIIKSLELEKIEEPLEYTCPNCGGLLKFKSGKFGKFIGCSNYPECDYSRNFKNRRKR